MDSHAPKSTESMLGIFDKNLEMSLGDISEIFDIEFILLNYPCLQVALM